ncbi:glycine-rich domain-containing protein [Pseudomonas fluorescens]|uniref:glycine-rich domain-containing protein n=1 Tax=Pseudomonas fluorescens TaxID=294 RepID=UPI003D189C07
MAGGSGAFGGDGSTTIGAGGGGGGGISNRLCTVVPGSVISVTVGAGGAAVTVEGDPGIAGGTSSFGSFCSATGGRGGVMNNGAQSGVGGRW